MKKIEDLRYFYKLTNILLSERYRFHTKLKKALNTILEYAQSEIGSILILQDEKYLEVVASTNMKIINQKIDLTQENTPAVEAFYTKKVLKRELPLDEKNRYNCKHFVIFPIVYHKKTLGVLTITKRKNDDIEYSDKEIKIIQKFINSISILIYNVILEENLEKEKENLKKINKKLIETQRMKEKLIHLIIHDLKSPLAQVISNLDLLLHSKNLKKSDFEIIDSALMGCEDLKRMILNLLDVYKLENGSLMINKTKEDIVKILNEVVHKFKSFLKIKNLKLIKKFYKNECYAYVDKDLLIRVFNNLLHNAIKYTPNGEKIILTVTCNKETVTIKIKNTGIGIDKKILKNIFNLFYTSKHDHESSGMGLAFCKMAVEAMGGEIKVKSEPSNWTEFIINFHATQKEEFNSEILKIEL